MSCSKRKNSGGSAEGDDGSFDSKRFCMSDDSNSNDMQPYEYASKRIPTSFTGEERQRLLHIMENQFNIELQAKEDEVVEIEERIQKTQKTLQYLCYAVVSDFYSREKTITSVASSRQRRIHPAVKKLLSGKAPPGTREEPCNTTTPAETSNATNVSLKRSNILLSSINETLREELNEKDKKVPRYIPPKPKQNALASSLPEPVRGGQNRTKKTLVIGNVSKWLPPDTRDDAASHKWMMYVRGPKDAPDISGFVSKVRFFLHPSYRPNDVVQVVCPPFQLSRRGWGEFPVRVQVHFSSPLNKPVDIIHNLKLDRTYTGLQTLGAETVAEVWLHVEELQILNSSESSSNAPSQAHRPVKRKSEEGARNFESPEVKREASSSISSAQSTSTVNVLPTTITSPIKPPLIQSPNPVNPLASPLKTNCNEEATKIPTFSATNATDTSREQILPSKSTFISPSKNIGVVISNSPKKVILNSPIKISAPAPGSNNTIRVKTSSELGAPVSAFVSPNKSLSVINTVALSATKSSSTTIGQPSSVKTVPSVSKPLTIVRCVDSSGNVRLVQMDPSMVAKVLQSNTTTSAGVSPSKSDPQQVISITKSLPSPKSIVAVSPTKVVPVTSVSSGTVLQPKVQLPVAPSTALLRPNMPGVRPVLRLIRPPGDPNVRPVLVASSSVRPGTGQPFTPRVPTAGNGSRPVLVLKEGKLYLMKSPVTTTTPTCTSSTPSIVSKPSVVTSTSNDLQPLKQVSQTPGHSAPSLSESNISALGTEIQMTDSTAVKIPDLLFTPKSNSAEVVDVKQASQIIRPPLNNNGIRMPVPSQNHPALKPRLSVAAPILRKPVGSDTAMHIVNGYNVGPGQRLSAPLSKPIVKPGMSLLKSGVSLLKSNAGLSNASSAPQSPVNSPTVSPCPSPLVFQSTPPPPVTKRIILGRASGSSTVTSTSHHARLYREHLSLIMRTCPSGPGVDIWRAVRWMVRNLPLVHQEARQIEYKVLYPYCAPDEKTFCSWNVGKQRACEWLRAKSVQRLLKDAGWNSENLWSTREIVLWARQHGYTPGLCVINNEDQTKESCRDICEYTAPTDIERWLTTQENPTCKSETNSRSPIDESDEEIDIISSDSSPSRVRIKEEPPSDSLTDTSEGGVEEMPLEPALRPLGQLVCDTLNRFGIKLSSEEVVPNVRYPAAQRVLVQVMKSLTEDLVRRGLADAWGSNIAKQPSSIDISNICGAMLHRPELDILTCSGLGIHSSICSSTVTPSKSTKPS